jgi:hypothetical protein
MASVAEDASKAFAERILPRYAELSRQGEQLRQILVAKGKVPCTVWAAYNQACLDYLQKSQKVFDQLAQKGIVVDQVVYSAGQPVLDPSSPGSVKTLRVAAPLRPPAFGFVASECPGIATFQGVELERVGWVPVPIISAVDLGSIPGATLTAIGTGMIFVLSGGGVPLGAAAYGAYKSMKAISIWIEDYFDPPVRILQAFTECFVKLQQGGLSPAQASAQCSASQASAQQYAKDKAAAESWGFWSWVGVGTAVLVVGGALALYLRRRVAGAAGAARMLMGSDDVGRLTRAQAQRLAQDEWDYVWSVEEVPTPAGTVVRRVEGKMGAYHGTPIVQQFRVRLHSNTGPQHWIAIRANGAPLFDGARY